MDELKVKIDGKEHIVGIEEENNVLKVHLDGKIYNVETSLRNVQPDIENKKESQGSVKDGRIVAAIPGIIYSVDVKEGDRVNKDQKLLSLMAMKMENQVLSPKNGIIKKIYVKKADKVNKGDFLFLIE